MNAIPSRSGDFPVADLQKRRPGGRRASFLLILLAVPSIAAAADQVLIGSKKFTESYVLGEIARETFRRDDIASEHKHGMGGTIILWEALRSGQIDLYPEYSGTIQEEILRNREKLTQSEMREALGRFGVAMSDPLGFNNTYALVMRRSEAARLGIQKISDLAHRPELRFGLTH